MSFMDTRQKIECQTLCVKMFYIFHLFFFSVKKFFFFIFFLTEKNVYFHFCVAL